jgi:hypothetical protein
MMATCLTLFLLAGLVVRRYSPTLAVVMAAVVLIIPPLAVIVANAGRERGPSRRDRRDPGAGGRGRP